MLFFRGNVFRECFREFFLGEIFLGNVLGNFFQGKTTKDSFRRNKKQKVLRQHQSEALKDRYTF